MAQQYTETDYHSFKDPDFGAKDYPEQWADNLGWFDSRIVRRGLKSDRPAATENGRIWITTDSGSETVYLDDGSQWIAIAGKDVGGGTVQRDEVQIADGSTTDPKLTFQNDTDTGLYRVGADTLGVTTGGTKAAEFGSGGNLTLPNGDLDLKGNWINNPIAIDFERGGVNAYRAYQESDDSLRFTDLINSVDGLVLQSGGNVEIPNGNLNLKNTANITNIVTSDVQGAIRANVDSSTTDDYATIARVNDASTAPDIIFHCDRGNGVAFKVSERGTPSDLLVVNDNGNVDIPNGDLNLGTNNLIDVNAIRAGSASALTLHSNGGGSDRIALYDAANSQDILKANEGGNVEIPNGNLTITTWGEHFTLVDSDDGTSDYFVTEFNSGVYRVKAWDDSAGTYTRGISIDKNGNVEIPNGDLTLSGSGASLDMSANTSSGWNDMTAASGISVWKLSTNGQNIVIQDGTNSQVIARFKEGGNVEVANGALQLSGANPNIIANNVDLNADSSVVIDIDNTNSSDFQHFRVTHHNRAEDLFAARENGGDPFVDVPNTRLEVQSERVDRQPNAHIPTSQIDDADHAEIWVHVPAGQSIEVWQWGCLNDSGNTPTGLTVELFDETAGSSVSSANTAHNTGSPIASDSAGTTASNYTLRLDNSTGGKQNASARFGYTVS